MHKKKVGDEKAGTVESFKDQNTAPVWHTLQHNWWWDCPPRRRFSLSSISLSHHVSLKDHTISRQALLSGARFVGAPPTNPPLVCCSPMLAIPYRGSQLCCTNCPTGQNSITSETIRQSALISQVFQFFRHFSCGYSARKHCWVSSSSS